jgi:hypothetical protein
MQITPLVEVVQEGALQISKSIRRICDGYPPLAGSRHKERLIPRPRAQQPW